MKHLTIGQLARRANVNITTVRYYERCELLMPDTRSEAGYRLYSEANIEKLNFIKNAQSLGFTLEEISALLKQADVMTDCEDVKNQAKDKIASVDEKIKALEEMKTSLQKLYDECENQGPAARCVIIEAMNEFDSKGRRH